MGGGGGYFKPEKSLDELLKENSNKEEVESFKQDVNTYLSNLLVNVNDRDTEKIQTHIDTLKKALEKEIEGAIELKFGGSVSKHTYANGLSDIDILVGINKSSLANSTPSEVLNYFQEMIKERLPGTKVKVGDLAVTVKFSSEHEIQLLPSVITKTGHRIAVPGKNEWSNVVRPQKFAEKLTQINRENSGRVVPIIKLFKVINNQLAKGLQLSGYHIESLAINFFKSYKGDMKYHTMVKEFCNYSQKAVLTPIKDSTGQSINVDGYLGSSGSINRRQISKALERLSNKMNRSDSQKSLDEWKKLLGE
ncbi:CBASS oligonucleotide cyclase [Neobacillus drentensis]|uniref:CBASS oligonucleotide cyclase n=1 Tax=Neobacillus drentensis TaxID=220684 RepID=UPI002FFE0C2A